MERWTIWDEMQRMQDEMDRLFENISGPAPARRLLAGPEGKAVAKSNYRQPLADIYETDREVVATLELPGVNKEDIDINVSDNALEVKVEKSDRKEEKQKGVYRMERTYSGFYRRMTLPANVKADKCEATYKNGVLEIKVPKEEAKQKQKKIEVK